ncbi:hypothetical protein [Acerihabitans arboris]|uniref:Uncharacterized protein n=1 Tax=Acerihabitans arboris TaxID=2691583 RepID=A0A845SM61_9GAMM|nr:hypothetical protein [Acerihabitans arboris]NDL63658.1 hypothetical protein [Acerihabitans arboris]
MSRRRASTAMRKRAMTPLKAVFPGSGRWKIFTLERGYRENSNVLETRVITPSGVALPTGSVSSALAGRLPRSEPARG